MPDYKTPGIYIEELAKFPPSIASVETAIPVFIGYTEKAQQKKPKDLLLKPVKIESLLDYEHYFGQPCPEKNIRLAIDDTQAGSTVKADVPKPSKYLMHYSLQIFFANGGGPCYIVSVGGYSTREVIALNALRKGLKKAARQAEVTLLVFPDSTNMASPANYYTLHKEAMEQAAELKDRFVVMDIWVKPKDASFNAVQTFRNFHFGGMDVLKYAAAYYPRIFTGCDYAYDPSGETVTVTSKSSPHLNGTLKDLEEKNSAFFHRGKAAIANLKILLPVSSAVVGVYAQVDNSRGVWKAPANVNIDNAIAPEFIITDQQQQELTIDTVTGKSINAIRSFPGRGPAIIWGARTLAGNDNEWRYVPVRRFFNMVEESTKAATEQFVFEPNDRNTWVRVRAMIENFLSLQWRSGALQGATPREAFFVKVGLNETMTHQDILEGRMIVEIGMAVVRPAEFIILRFMHKMLQEA